MEQQLIADGFQLIVPHRPGYYGTPLGDRADDGGLHRIGGTGSRSPKHRTRRRHRNIGRRPAGARICRALSERTSAVILQCAQTHRWDDRRWAPIVSIHGSMAMFSADVPRWLFCRFFPTLFRLGFPSTEHYLRRPDRDARFSADAGLSQRHGSSPTACINALERIPSRAARLLQRRCDLGPGGCAVDGRSRMPNAAAVRSARSGSAVLSCRICGGSNSSRENRSS